MGIIARFAKNKIAKNTSVLIISQVAARAFGIVYVAALARYVGAEGVGNISTANALNGLLVLVVGPGLDTLLIRDVAADKTKAKTYVGNIFFLRGMLSILFLLLTVAVTKIVTYPADTVRIIYAYTMVYLFDLLAEIPASVFRASEHMEYEAGIQVIRDLINISLSLFAIYLGWSLLSIALISALAQAIKLLLMMILLYRRFVRPDFSISGRTIKSLLISSLPFGLLVILHTIHAQLGILIISLYKGADAVGIYSVANSLIGMLLLLPAAFSAAIFPTMSSFYANAKQDLRHFYRICFKYLLIVGFPLGLGAILVGDKVLLLVYGDDFTGSAAVLRILAISLFTLVGYSNGPLLKAAKRQRFFAWTESLKIAANAFLCLLLVPRWGAVGAAIGFTLSGIGTFFVHSIASHRQVGLNLPWFTMARVFLATAMMGLVVCISLQSNVPWLVVVFIAAPITYGLSLLALDILKQDELRILAGTSSSSWT